MTRESRIACVDSAGFPHFRSQLSFAGYHSDCYPDSDSLVSARQLCSIWTLQLMSGWPIGAKVNEQRAQWVQWAQWAPRQLGHKWNQCDQTNPNAIDIPAAIYPRAKVEPKDSRSRGWPGVPWRCDRWAVCPWLRWQLFLTLGHYWLLTKTSGIRVTARMRRLFIDRNCSEVSPGDTKQSAESNWRVEPTWDGKSNELLVTKHGYYCSHCWADWGLFVSRWNRLIINHCERQWHSDHHRYWLR